MAHLPRRHCPQRTRSGNRTAEQVEVVGRSFPVTLTQPVIADQKVLVADKDNPVLCAFAAGTGEPVWRFIPGGRIDSSPTIYKGLVYFGATDGFVYCLDLSDGALRWKYQAAPALANHMYLERHGSDASGAWQRAGDERPALHRGRPIDVQRWRHSLSDSRCVDRAEDQRTCHGRQGARHGRAAADAAWRFLNMPMALSDLLSSNGKKIFMRYQPFDLEGNRLDSCSPASGTVTNRIRTART